MPWRPGQEVMYVPESCDDSGLVDKTENGVVVMTAARQCEILDEFISRNASLSENRTGLTRSWSVQIGFRLMFE
jgi:hypothetical protein